MNELNSKIDMILRHKTISVSKYGVDEIDRRLSDEESNIDYQKSAILDLITEQVRLGRIDTAKHIFTVLWDEDGAPFQRDDPPREILNYLAELEKGDK